MNIESGTELEFDLMIRAYERSGRTAQKYSPICEMTKPNFRTICTVRLITKSVRCSTNADS